MVKSKIMQTIPLPKRDFLGLTLVNNRVWFAGVEKGKILHGEVISRGKFESKGETATLVKDLGGLAWDGSRLYVMNRKEKQILRTTPKMESLEPVLSLKDLSSTKDMPLVFLVNDAELTGLTWGKGMLWFGCQAGYSSSFYAVDLKKKKVALRLLSRGPKPDGMCFDKTESSFWTLDARNREFSKYTSDAQFTGEVLSVPVENPTGLVIDQENTFWTSDRKKGILYQIKKEAN